MKNYIVKVLEKLSDEMIVFKCYAESKEEIIQRYKLNGTDILKFFITEI